MTCEFDRARLITWYMYVLCVLRVYVQYLYRSISTVPVYVCVLVKEPVNDCTSIYFTSSLTCAVSVTNHS